MPRAWRYRRWTRGWRRGRNLPATKPHLTVREQSLCAADRARARCACSSDVREMFRRDPARRTVKAHVVAVLDETLYHGSCPMERIGVGRGDRITLERLVRKRPFQCVRSYATERNSGSAMRLRLRSASGPEFFARVNDRGIRSRPGSRMIVSCDGPTSAVHNGGRAAARPASSSVNAAATFSRTLPDGSDEPPARRPDG
jgi:hypothetical protein